MIRGGKRKGSGRKPTWKHSPTQAIRVPKVFAEQLLEIARKLDHGDCLELDTSSQKLSAKAVESVSSSDEQLSGLMKQLELINESLLLSSQKASSLVPHTTRALSRRLGIPDTTLRRKTQKMSSSDFAYWASQLDPDGLGWEYDPKTKKYFHIYMEPVSGS